jgi:hypothetical protein
MVNKTHIEGGTHEIHFCAATSAGNLSGQDQGRDTMQTAGYLLQRTLTASRGPEYRTTDTGRKTPVSNEPAQDEEPGPNPV